MKRIIALVIAALMLVFAFAACGEDEADLYKVDEGYATRAAAFYGRMNKNNFYAKMTLTVNNETYSFTQATNGANITTIADFEGTERDSYKIFVKNTEKRCVHTLDIANKKFDTLITDNGQDFLLADYTANMFKYPSKTGDADFNGKTYYCEVYDSAAPGSSEVTGQDRYYFDEGKVVAIEILSGKEITMTIVFEEYSNAIPNDIYVTVPDGFKGGTVQNEVIVDYNSLWGDMSWGE